MDGMDWITYVPEYDGNRDRPEDKRITVEILPLTVREVRRISGGITAKRAKGGGFKTNQGEISLKTFENHARDIRNLDYEGKQITTVEELLDTTYIELADEIEAAISDVSILNEGDIKNFRSQSGGSPVKNPGTATNAMTGVKKHVTAEENTGEKTDDR